MLSFKPICKEQKLSKTLIRMTRVLWTLESKHHQTPSVAAPCWWLTEVLMMFLPREETQLHVWPEVLWSPVLRLLAQWGVLTVQELEEPLAELLAEDLWVKAHLKLQVCGIRCRSSTRFINRSLKEIISCWCSQTDSKFLPQVPFSRYIPITRHTDYYYLFQTVCRLFKNVLSSNCTQLI